MCNQSILDFLVNTFASMLTWIGEDPSGDVGSGAHDVFNVQTGLQASFSCPLGANNPIHHRAMLEGPTKHVHELGQVSWVVVLLQKLKGGGVMFRISELVCKRLLQNKTNPNSESNLSNSLTVVLN